MDVQGLGVYIFKDHISAVIRILLVERDSLKMFNQKFDDVDPIR